MQITLKKTKISLSEPPNTSVPKAILVICNDGKPIYSDVIEGKQTYKLPKGVNYKDVLFVYLRVF